MKKIINGIEYETFKPNKSTKELGIDTSRKFIVVNSQSGDDYFQNGDIISYKEESIYIDGAYFQGDRDVKSGLMWWKELAYYDEEKPKFKVGDRVRVIPGGWQYIENGIEGSSAMSLVKSENNIKEDKITKISYSVTHKNWWYRLGSYSNMYTENSLELVEQQPKITNTIITDIKEEPREFINKSNNNKTNKIMSNITNFFNDLTVSAEDKELRKAGLKDSELNWNVSAVNIVLNLEAKERNYKSFDKLRESIGMYNEGAMLQVSELELETLFSKFYDKLLETAKKFNKENDKK